MIMTTHAQAYQDWTQSTAIYPDAGNRNVQEIMYLSLGLVGEAGEVANKAKKLYRDGDSYVLRESLRPELGDVLWYIARLCETLGTTIDIEMEFNRAKLEKRIAGNTVKGAGDYR